MRYTNQQLHNILNKDIRSPDDYIDAFIDQYVTGSQEETAIRTLYQHYQ